MIHTERTRKTDSANPKDAFWFGRYGFTRQETHGASGPTNAKPQGLWATIDACMVWAAQKMVGHGMKGEWAASDTHKAALKEFNNALAVFRRSIGLDTALVPAVPGGAPAAAVSSDITPPEALNRLVTLTEAYVCRLATEPGGGTIEGPNNDPRERVLSYLDSGKPVTGLTLRQMQGEGGDPARVAEFLLQDTRHFAMAALPAAMSGGLRQDPQAAIASYQAHQASVHRAQMATPVAHAKDAHPIFGKVLTALTATLQHVAPFASTALAGIPSALARVILGTVGTRMITLGDEAPTAPRAASYAQPSWSWASHRRPGLH